MSLERFIQAQDKGGSYDRALAELKAGRKTGHWIWWVFPQLKGLGTSHNSTFYGLNDEAEARAYIQHPILGQRYCDCVKAVYMQLYGPNSVTPLALMGSDVDVLKLRSSLELFLRHGRTAHEVRSRIMMMVQIEKILLEKLDWVYPVRARHASLDEFRSFDPFLASTILDEGHMLISGQAGAGKSLLLNTLLPHVRAKARHAVVIDCHGDITPLPRIVKVDLNRQSPDYMSSVAADLLGASAVAVSRGEHPDGPDWNHLIMALADRVISGMGPARPWFLFVDVSGHASELPALWEFLPRAKDHGCTVIVTIQGAGRLATDQRQYFEVIAQFCCGFRDDVQAFAPADYHEWVKAVQNLEPRQFLLKVGGGPVGGYEISKTF